ncbi:hypothetical protein GCM10010472_05360 [Pseudonocardia halophobica]|uniref:Succinyl-CoA synthetase-like flavodoxin domain-containing protein n=1 Tax=Pseudonocardia halophobica TaxID=29401 RepID=A0A9W6UEU3_9PSEU|nr:hypothetical protein GCM10017577_63380 [Pseudonocardia halophobica]
MLKTGRSEVGARAVQSHTGSIAGDYTVYRALLSRGGATRSDLVLPTLVGVLDAAQRAGATVVHSRLASRARDYSGIVPALQTYVRAAEAHEAHWAAQPSNGLHDEDDLVITESGAGPSHDSGS